MKAKAVALTHFHKDPEAFQFRPAADTFSLLRRVFSYTRPHRRKLWLLTAHVTVRGALLPLCAWAMGEVINGPIERKEVHGILWGTAAYAALAVLTNLLFINRYRLALELGEAVIHDLRADVFRHVQRMPLVFFETTKIGRIISVLTSSIDSIRSGVQDVVFISAVQFAQMLVSGVLMAWYSPLLFALVLAMGPFVWWANQHFTGRIAAAQRRASESFSRITATVAETVNGLRVTRAFVRENTNGEFFSELAQDQGRHNVNAARTSAKFLPILEFMTNGFNALLIAVGGWRVLAHGNGAPVGDIVRFLFLSALFFEPIKNIGNQYNAALLAMVGAERVFRMLDTPPAWQDAPGCVPLPLPAQGSDCGMRVEFRDVRFEYEKGRPVLRSVSFTAEPGWTVALVGQSGSGKTTVTSLASKFYPVAPGAIRVDGIDLMQIQSASLREQMAVVPQQCFLFSGTVLENIRFARPDASEREVREVLERLGFDQVLDALPNGLLAEVGEGGNNLSAGERQFVGFARALLARPRLLILDEATSAIDALAEAKIQQALPELLRGRTSFVVAHRLSTIRHADLILVLREGEVVERGRHAELLALGGEYARLHAGS